MGAASEFLGYARWWLGYRFGRDSPLVETVIIHYECNLRCRHCSIHDSVGGAAGKSSLSYEAIVGDLGKKYRSGARIAYFEGGEPTLWEDGSRNLGDLIDEAREIGYYNIGYTTNGASGKIFTNSDVIAVSLDGAEDIHDYIRGKGVFSRLMDTVDGLEFGGRVYANAVLHKGNLDQIRKIAETVSAHPGISGVIFNFITPPPYDLALSPDERARAAEEILGLKGEGLPVLNSVKGLKLLTDEDWDGRCPRRMSAFLLPDGSSKSGCPMSGTDSCRHCGFAAVREYSLVAKGDVSVIRGLSSVFASGSHRK